jgi:septal ring factor EnvC (AmiA/AmiB activator)
MLEDITTKAMVIPNDYVTADFEVGECLVRLDDTTMKRIAEYNLGKELKSLNKKVKNRKDELAQLEKEIEIRNKKLETIENLMETIWQDDEFDTKNYIPRSPYEDEYDDFDEEDY